MRNKQNNLFALFWVFNSSRKLIINHFLNRVKNND